ncbi:hypothetical protein MRX96_058287 [Rhipicephalus microplus]
MAPQKGKQGTKGQKQIVEENKQTIKFYSIMAIAALIVHFIRTHDVVEGFYYIVLHAAVPLLCSCLRWMHPNNAAGMGEHLKDLIILTACIQTLSLASTYVWYLWLVAPAYAFYLLWVNVLAPWVFQPAPPEVDDKKQKKLERKGRRH